jgi:hypothetical protein
MSKIVKRTVQLGQIGILLVVLSACGGGGEGGGNDSGASGTGNTTTSVVSTPTTTVTTTPTTTTTTVTATTTSANWPFASPAMVLPAGQTAKLLFPSSCTVAGSTTAVTEALVQITANGNVSFIGAVGAEPPALLAEVIFADTTIRQVSGVVNGESSGSQSGLQITTLKIPGDSITIRSYGSGSVAAFGARSGRSYNCTGIINNDTITLEQALSSERVASTIVSGSTGTIALSLADPAYTQVGDVVSWDSKGTTASAFSKYISFDLTTARLGQGNSLDPNTHTLVNFALPAQGNGRFGYFAESWTSDGGRQAALLDSNLNVLYQRYSNPALYSGNGRRLIVN